MARPRMRPLFRLALPIARPHLMDKIAQALASGAAPVTGRVLRRHVELTVRPEVCHFWSPHLSLDLLEEESGILLRGRYAPHPHIWMFVMAVYGVLGLVTLGALVYGYSQWSLGWTPTAFWALPPCAAGVAGTWIMSAIGQRLAQPQMELLQDFLDDAVRRASEPPAALEPKGDTTGERPHAVSAVG